MLDHLNRTIEYLRISVTDRCNMRCIYCMPEEGVKWLSHTQIVSYEEILRLCRCFAELGVGRIKLTGGEPLVRKGLPALIRELKAIPGITEVTLTTNGLLLEQQLDELVGAGLNAVNISLDSLENETFWQITRCGDVTQVKRSIEAAISAPSLKVKLNCVPLRGINDQSLISLAEYARYYEVSVRFIEMMPIGLGADFGAWTEEELLVLFEQKFGVLTPYTGVLGNGPGHYYSAPGFVGKIGFISAISHRFCNQCNRIRLTSTGFLKTCLQYDHGVDLSALLRSGVDDDTMKQRMLQAIAQKPAGHHFDGPRSKDDEDKKMFQIGG